MGAAARQARWYQRQKAGGLAPMSAFVQREFRDLVTERAKAHRVPRDVLIEAALQTGLRQLVPSLIQQVAAKRTSRAVARSDRPRDVQRGSVSVSFNHS